MYSSLRKKRIRLFSKNAMVALLASLMALSLMDVFFDYLGLGKGSLFTLLWLMFTFVFVYSAYLLINDYKIENAYFKFVITLLICYGFFTVLRGWSFSKADLTSFLREPYIFWPFFVPLLVFLRNKLASFGFLIRCFYYLGLVFLVIIIILPTMALQLRTAELLIYPFAIGSGFLLMNSIYLSNTKVNVSFLVMFLATLSFIFLARRAGLFILFGLLFSSYMLVVFNKQKPLMFKILPILCIVVIGIFFSVGSYSEILLSKINDRLFEDTRSIVFDLFFEDMKSSMVFGKGMNGTYYCPIGGGALEDGIDYEVTYYRQGIENGYLQLMLSGGITHIVLFLMVLVPAALNGIFRSSNQFTKSCGIMVLLWLVFMFGAGLPSLSLGYILVWLCVGVCYQKSIRTKTNKEIKDAFKDIISNATKDIPKPNKF